MQILSRMTNDHTPQDDQRELEAIKALVARAEAILDSISTTTDPQLRRRTQLQRQTLIDAKKQIDELERTQ